MINEKSKHLSAIQKAVFANNIRAYKLVRECINGEICGVLQGYLELKSHERKTWNSERFVKIPCIKLNMVENLSTMGSKLYNELPMGFTTKIASFKG